MYLFLSSANLILIYLKMGEPPISFSFEPTEPQNSKSCCFRHTCLFIFALLAISLTVKCATFFVTRVPPCPAWSLVPVPYPALLTREPILAPRSLHLR